MYLPERKAICRNIKNLRSELPMLSSREAITANNRFLTLEIRRGNVETSWIMGSLITKEFVITSPYDKESRSLSPSSSLLRNALGLLLGWDWPNCKDPEGTF